MFLLILSSIAFTEQGVKNPFRIACYCKTLYTSSSTIIYLGVSLDRLVQELGLATQFSRLLRMLFMEWKLQSLNISRVSAACFLNILKYIAKKKKKGIETI